MTGSQDEDCLDSVRVQLFEAVGRGGAGVAVAGMRADDGLGWVGGLVSSRQPGVELPLQLGRVAGVPRVGVAGSPRSHRTQISGRWSVVSGCRLREGQVGSERLREISQTKNNLQL